MKEIVQKRNIALQGALPINRKMQEVAVVKHYHPNPMRQTMGNFPEVRCFKELPEGSRYLHLHPVFKFVDSFLSSTSINNKETGNLRPTNPCKRKPVVGKITNKCECPVPSNVRYVGGDSVVKTFVTKKSKMPCRSSIHKPERLKTNLTNISSKNNIRVSLRDTHCKNCQYMNTREDPEMEKLDSSSIGTGSDYYIEQLKEEIKQNKTNSHHLTTQEMKQNKPSSCDLATLEIKQNKANSCHLSTQQQNDAYVDKLKDELMCNKAKCLYDARSIINELQNEILNYRLQAKAKYSSSCSDLASSEKALSNVRLPPQRTEDKAFVQQASVIAIDEPAKTTQFFVDESTIRAQAEVERSKPCETLWQSKGSLPSSSDMEVGPVTQEINFEEKLEEANSLIEKVRKALKDIGKGIYKTPEQRKANVESKESVKQCVETCSFHGQCLISTWQKDGRKNKTVVENEDDIKKAKSSETCVKKDTSQKPEKQTKATPEGNVLEELKVKKIEQNQAEKPEGTVPEEVLEIDDVIMIKSASGLRRENILGDSELIRIPTPELQEEKVTLSCSESMELLQTKLNTISEKSESDISTDKNQDTKKIQEELPILPLKMERGSSPIDLTEDLAAKIEETIVPTEKAREYIEAYKCQCAELSKDHEGFKYQSADASKQQSIQPPKETSFESDMTFSIGLRSFMDSVVKTDNLKRETKDKCELIQQNEHLKITSDDQLIHDEHADKTCKGISDKSAKLSIQLMPPISIRRGLVMQRTLNLCIKPTGSVTNDIAVEKSNVDYQEIVGDSEAPLEETFAFVKCPEDCKNPNGDYCKFKVAEEPYDEHKGPVVCPAHGPCRPPAVGLTPSLEKTRQAIASRLRSSGSGLNEDALLLFRSYQILDDKYQSVKEASQSLTTLTKHIAKNVSTMEGASGKKSDKIEPVEKVSDKSYSTSHDIFTSDTGSESIDGFPPIRTPWEIGFYQTKSTQCSRTYLPVEPASPPEEMPKSSSGDDMPKTSSIEASPGTISPLISPRSLTEETPKSISDEIHPIDKTFARVTAKVSEASEEQRGEELGLSSKKKQTPEKPARDPIDLAHILNVLNEGKDNVTLSMLESDQTINEMEKPKRSIILVPLNISNISPPKFEPPARFPRDEVRKSILSVRGSFQVPSAPVKTSASLSSSSSVSTTSSIEEKRTQDAEKKAEKASKDLNSSSSNTTGSSGSSNVRVRDNSSLIAIRSSHQSTCKRPHEPDKDLLSENSVRSLKSASDEKQTSSETKGFTQGKKVKTKDRLKSEIDHEVSKEQKPAGKRVQKVDENVQVSLASSSGSETSSETYSEKERADTITYFIKGLTGTSQQELDKLRSNPSFPKGDVANWSKTVLRPSHERNSLPKPTKDSPEEMSKRSIYEVSREKVVDTHDYVHKTASSLKDQDNASIITELSDRTKMQRLREFQKIASGKLNEDKTSHAKVVMRISEERGDAGEGDDRALGYSRRDLPFYRRVLGRILEPSQTRQPMQTSHSDANPVDESISEGEIKCKSSASIGEIHPCKYYADVRKKTGKSGGVRYLKRHPEDIVRKELGDKSLRIARQRTQYNNWVTYYLQKHHNLSLIDDSSSSPVSSSKK